MLLSEPSTHDLYARTILISGVQMWGEGSEGAAKDHQENQHQNVTKKQEINRQGALLPFSRHAGPTIPPAPPSIGLRVYSYRRPRPTFHGITGLSLPPKT